MLTADGEEFLLLILLCVNWVDILLQQELLGRFGTKGITGFLLYKVFSQGFFVCFPYWCE